MKQHVHAADAQHGGVEVVAVKGVLVEAAAGGGVFVDGIGVMLDQVLGGRYEETRRAAGRVADHVLGRGCGHVDHQLDDVARGTELPVLTCGRDLAKHVLVEIALGIAVGHIDFVELIDHVRQHPRCGHHEECVLHVMGVGASALPVPIAPQGFHEGEDPITHGLEHALGGALLEARPA